MKSTLSRRTFVQTAATAAAALAIPSRLVAQGNSRPARAQAANGYDELAKLASNENPYGPSEAALAAISDAQKYANRYRYPDPGLIPAIANLHGVGGENILIGAGSSEILHAAAGAFLQPGKKVIGVEPTYSSVYEYATGLKTAAVRLPLGKDCRQDTAALIRAVNDRAGEIGLVYVCNPNNPTGIIVPKDEIMRLVEGIPADIPLLVDEAYHEYVEDPRYASASPLVKEGRRVIVVRTFSKLYGLAGLRLGYAVAPGSLIEPMRARVSGMSVNALVKFAAVAALKDVEAQQRVRRATVELRKKVAGELEKLGYPVLPSETNFFMVHIRRPITEAIRAFRQRGVLVGRPFPPMLDYLRVSVGSDDEMDRFLGTFKEVFA